jgi:hypothetical protein
MNQDEDHLRLLSIFHYVCAGFAAFFACIPGIYVVMGLVMLFASESFGSSKDLPPAFVGVFFILFGGVMMLLGWALAACLVYAGRCLGKRKHYTFCLVVAGIACMFMPFGTILGIFTILVLLRPTIKPLFAAAVPPEYVQ